MKLTGTIICFISLMTLIVAQDQNKVLDLTLESGKEYPQEVLINKNSNFTVKLSGSISGGFQWLIVPQDMEKTGAAKIIKFIDYTYDSSKTGVVGASLTTNVNFYVVGTGNAKLNLYFARSWILDTKIASN